MTRAVGKFENPGVRAFSGGHNLPPPSPVHKSGGSMEPLVTHNFSGFHSTTDKSEFRKWHSLHYTVDDKGGLKNNFSIIFPSFVHLLATKPMAKQSRALDQLAGGHLVEEYREEFGFFFPSNFQTVLFFFNFPKIFGNEIFIPINLIIFKGPPVQF